AHPPPPRPRPGARTPPPRPVQAPPQRSAPPAPPAGPTSDLEQALSPPQLLARGGIAQLQHPQAGPVRLVASPLPLEGVPPPPPPAPPPALGANTREILSSTLRYSDADIDALEQAKVVSFGAPEPATSR